MQSAPIDLALVRKLFSRTEKRQPADFIYREIAARMLERLQLVRLDPHRVLDLGCGRAADLPVLQSHYPNAHIVGMDAAAAFLQLAMKQQTAARSSVQKLLSLFAADNNSQAQLINADFCNTPLADDCADMIWSNLALHWHAEPDQVFKEWRRLLSVNGLLMFSCFGPDSLKEIRQAFDSDGGTPHTLPFVDMHDLGDMLAQAGFATPVMDMEIITLTYTSAEQLLTEVRALGGNPLLTRQKSLQGKYAWQRMRAQLEAQRNADGRIPLTLEVIYGHAFKPVPKKINPGVNIIKFDKLTK